MFKIRRLSSSGANIFHQCPARMVTSPFFTFTTQVKRYFSGSLFQESSTSSSSSEGGSRFSIPLTTSTTHVPQEQLKQQSINARVVSFPSWELFDAQSKEYKESVLSKKVRRRLAVEAGSPIGWCKYVTDEGDVIGINKFGESAPGEEVMKEYGFSVENVIAKAKDLLK